MVQIISSFSDFAAEIKQGNKYTVSFKVADKEYSIVYSELTSEEEIRSGAEFEKWFKDSYEKLDVRGLNAALNGQWRIWKMIRPNMTGMEAFEQFLKIPATITSAMMSTIEVDLMTRYPNLNKK